MYPTPAEQLIPKDFGLTSRRGGFIANGITTKDAQFAALEAFTGSANYDPYAAIINNYAFVAAANLWITASSFQYTRSEPSNETSPAVFANFTALPQLYNTTRVSNLTDFTLEIAMASPAGRRQLFVTGTYGNSAQMMSDIFDLANSTVQALRNVSSLVYSLSFQPVPTVITSKAATRGGNSLGLTAAVGNLFNVLLTVSWEMEGDDALVNRQAKLLFDRTAVVAKEHGVYNDFLYLNYAAQWQDPISGYGNATVARLQAVSKKYDPKGVFQRQVPGGFKLFD